MGPRGVQAGLFQISIVLLLWRSSAQQGVDVRVAPNGSPHGVDETVVTVASMSALRKSVEALFERIGRKWWLADADGMKVASWKRVADVSDELRRFTVVPEDRLFQWSPRKMGERFPVKMSGVDGIEIETVGISPKVFLLHNLFTEEEADIVIDTALKNTGANALALSSTGFDTSGKRTANSQRTSSNAWDTNSPNALELMKRSFEALRIPYAQTMADGLQVLRYEPSQAYISHTDWFEPEKSPAGYDWDPTTATGSNRYATVFFYLRPAPSGGYTVFPEGRVEAELEESEFVSVGRDPAAQAEASKEAREVFANGSWELDLVDKCYSRLAVKPVRLGAALFYHQDPMTGELQTSAEHAACPSLTGHKWGANMWLWNRARHLTTPAASTGSDGKVNAMFVNKEQHHLDLEYSNDGQEWHNFWPMPAGTFFGANTYVGHHWRMVSAGQQEVRRWEVPVGISQENIASDGTQGDEAAPADWMRRAEKGQIEL